MATNMLTMATNFACWYVCFSDIQPIEIDAPANELFSPDYIRGVYYLVAVCVRACAKWSLYGFAFCVPLECHERLIEKTLRPRRVLFPGPYDVC